MKNLSGAALISAKSHKLRDFRHVKKCPNFCVLADIKVAPSKFFTFGSYCTQNKCNLELFCILIICEWREKKIEIPCFLTVLLSILFDKLLINYIKAETSQTKLNSSICALFETIPQREFIETGYDPTASNRSRICSTTSNDNNIIQSDANMEPEKTPGKGMYY